MFSSLLVLVLISSSSFFSVFSVPFPLPPPLLTRCCSMLSLDPGSSVNPIASILKFMNQKIELCSFSLLIFGMTVARRLKLYLNDHELHRCMQFLCKDLGIPRA